MSGYIINFYKYAMFPSYMKEEMVQKLIRNSKTSAKPSESTSLIVYGDYDRLNIERIDDFCRFRDVDHYALRWMGPRQTLLLYNIESGSPEGDDILDVFSSLKAKKGKNTKSLRNFAVFTMVTLNPQLHKMEDYGAALKECCKLIHKQVDEAKESLIEKDEVSCRVYGSFSSSELVIVWNVNQYVDALRLTDMLRHASFLYGDNNQQKLLPFASLYSIIAHIKAKPSNRKHTNIEGRALLKFVFQDGIDNRNELKEYLCKEICESIVNSFSQTQGIEIRPVEKGYGVAGIYDFAISMPAKYLCDPYCCPFRFDEPLHWNNEKIKKYISLTNVELYYDAFPESSCRPACNLRFNALAEFRGVDEGEHSLPAEIARVHDMIYGVSQNLENEEGKHSILFTREMKSSVLWLRYCQYGLRKVVKDMIPSSAGLCDSLDLMYSDYVHNCTNLISSAWAVDLTTQFTAIIDYIAGQFYRAQNDKKNGNPNLFSNIKGVYEIYIQMINHITQSKYTVFNIPNCHLRYIGQYDLILHGYYGWIKRLMLLGYTLDHKNGVQERLVPFITIDVFPEIRTTMYRLDHSYIEKCGEKGSEQEKNIDIDNEEIEKALAKQAASYIVSINMPLSSMTDFVRYAVTLCHEIAHYIIPNDRNRRNVVMGMLYYAELSACFCLAPVLLQLVNGEMTKEQERAINCILPQIRREFMAITYNTLRKHYCDIIHAQVQNNLKKTEKNTAHSEGETHTEVPAWDEYRTELQNVIQSLMLKEQSLKKMFDALGKEKDTFLEAVNDVFTDYSNRNELNNSDYLSESFLDEFKAQVEAGLIENHTYTQLKKYIKDLKRLYIRDLLYFDSSVINDAYREACQDLVMIRISNLNVVDYLVFLDRHRNDTNQLDKPLSRKDALRVSMVCDYLLSGKDGLARRSIPPHVLDKFDKLNEEYVDFFIRVPEMKVQATVDYRGCLKCLRGCFEETRKNLVLYFEEYSFVRELLMEQLKDSDILYRHKNAEAIINELGMRAFYAKWKSAVISKKKEDVKSGKTDPEVDRAIFDTNIDMIHKFQYQDTLKAISSSINCKQGSVSLD